MNTSRNDNIETKYFEDNTNRENQPINSNKETSRYKNKNILQSLAQSVHSKKRFNIQLRDIYVAKFTKNIQPGKEKIKQLNELQLQMINDQASSQKQAGEKQIKLKQFNSVQQQFLENIKTSLNKNLDKIPLFYPSSKFRCYWDILSVLARFYFIFVIPLDLGWQSKSFIFYDFLAISIVSMLIIIADLVLSLNTAYYKDGQLVTNRVRILKHSLLNSYGLQWFSIFLIFLFFFISISEEALYGMKQTFSFHILIVFLVHFKPLIAIVNYYEENLNLNKLILSCLELVKLLFIMFYSIHFFSCIWVLVGQYSMSQIGKSWILQSQVDESSWQIQYLQSFYYSAVTMFTIGYGDVTPQSPAEKIFAVTFIIVASIQLPYSVNTLGTIIQQISVYTEEKKRKLRILNSYLNQQKISQELQIQVREYLTYRWENEQCSKHDDADQLIGELSSELKNSLIIESYQQILKKCVLFQLGFSEGFKTNLVTLAKEISLSPEQEISLQQQQDPNLYYIISGQLQIHHPNGINLGIINTDQSIGLKYFITGTQTKEIYKSVGFSKLLMIEHKQFLFLLQDYPEDYEKFCKIRDQLLFQGNNSKQLLPQKCFSCQNQNHSILKCPQIHYIPDYEKITKKLSFPYKQSRQSFQRRIRIVNFLTKRQIYNDLQVASLQLQQNQHEIFKLYQQEYMIPNLNQELTIKKSKSLKIQDTLVEDSNLDFVEIVNTQNNIQFQKLNKFKKAVSKIITMNNENSQSLTDNQQINPKKQLEILLNRLDHRYNILQTLDNQIFNKEKEMIQHLIQQNSIDLFFDSVEFENAINYKHYFPQDNFNNLFKKQNRANNLKLIHKFSFYFLYPSKIIEQFKMKYLDIQSKLSQRRKNIYLTFDQVIK